MRTAVISHRGLCRSAARARRRGENTLAAFEAGLAALAALGLPPAIEFDVRRAAGGELVVVHDPTLRRVTGVRRRVRRATAAELRAFGVPTLEELIARFPQAELHLEIKERGIAARAGDVLRALHASDQTVVSSFLWQEAAPLARQVRVALTSAFPTRRLVRAAIDAGAWGIHPDHRRATAALVRAAHEAGLKVNAWTVNTPRAYARMGRMDVDAVFSDNPYFLLSP